MTTQPTPERPSEQKMNGDALEAVEQQQLSQKLELERLYRDVAQLRGWIQMLVSGLVLAILIAIIISSWLTYRLLVQQQMTRQEATKASTDQAKTLEQVEQLQQQLQSLTEQASQQSTELTDTTQNTQQELQQLSDRLQQLEENQPQKPFVSPSQPSKTTSPTPSPRPELQD